MQKIISVILSIIMLFFGIFIPGASKPEEPMTVGEWISAVDAEFGMETYESEVPYYEDITAENEYFAAIQIAYEWGMIDAEDTIDVDAAVKSDFVVKTLVKVARLECDEEIKIANAAALQYAEELAIAVGNGLIELKKDGSYKVFEMGYDACMELLAKVKEIWANKSFDEPEYEVETAANVKSLDTTDYSVDGDEVTLPENTDLSVGDVYMLPQNSENLEGGIYKVEDIENKDGALVAKSSSVDAEEVLQSVKFEGGIAPDLTSAQITDANGNVLQKANVENTSVIDDAKGKLVDKLSNGSFKIPGTDAKVKYAIKEGGFDISVSGDIVDGVNLAKSYSVTNLDIQTKFDANLAKADIKEAYVLLNYDAVDTTTVSGSYTASLAGADTADNGLSVIEQIKENFSSLKVNSGRSKIDLFTVDIPIPNCPAVTISLNVSLCLDVFGQAQIVVTSNNCKGYEIINNKGRVINDSVETNRQYNITGSAELTIGFGVGVGILTYDLIDLAINGGVGAYVRTVITAPNSNGDLVTQTVDVPVDIIAESTAVLDDADQITVCANAQFYGILTISVGQNSLLKKVGLSKTWKIYGMDNATFATVHIEETGIVDTCTRAA